MANTDSYIATIKEIARKRVSATLDAKAKSVVQNAVQGKPYSGFTGNSQTSYQFAKYNGNAMEYEFIPDNRSPLRAKIVLNEKVYLDNPFEGKPRKVKGKVKLLRDGETGRDTTKRILPIPQMPKSFMTYRFSIGTEYMIEIYKELENMQNLVKMLMRV